MSDRTDLFGHAPAQGGLFGAGEDRLQAPAERYTPDPEQVLQRLRRLLDTAQSAQNMP
jgi:predicted component of type VI protein secretion system